MLRIVSGSVLFVLLMISGRLSWADTFKCTRSDGSVFFTNDPAQVPSGCVIERVKDLPPIGNLPDPPAPAPGAKMSNTAQTQAGTMRSFDSFKSEAVLVVERFQAARQRVYRSSFLADKLQARRELAEIRAQASDLQNELNLSSLSSSEKQELGNLLAPVTE